MENIKIYLESGQVFIQSGSSAITGLNTSLSTFNSPSIYPANGELTASVVNTNNIKVVNSEGRIILNNVPFGDLFEKNGSTAIGASATAVRDNLNGQHYFGASTLETKLSTETAKITALENATKTSTNDRGIYINDAKGTTQGHLQITDTIANLQAGATTRVALTDISTGQGSIEFNVRAGANGSQTSVTALSIAGDSSFNNALVTFSQPVTFSSSVSGTSHLGNANLALTGDRSLTLGGNALTIKSSNTTNNESLIVADDGTVTIGPGSSQGAAILSIREGSGNGANSVSLTVADSLASNVSFTLPSSDGTNGQALITNGSGVLSFSTISGGGFDADHTLTANRSVNMNNNYLTFKDGTVTKLQYDPNTDKFTFSNGLHVQGEFSVNATSGMSAGAVKFREPAMGGSSGVILQAPSTNMSADTTFTLPASDGSSGQFLKTDGSGNLSFATAGGGGSTLTQVFTQSFLDDISTTTHYLPFKDINEQTTVYQEEAAFVMPYDGKIKQVTIRVATQVDNAGNFTVGVHTCPIGVSVFSQGNWTQEETEVLAFNGGSQADDHHAFHFVFDNAKHFDAGDAVSISLRASVDPGTNSYWYVTTLVEWDTTNGLGSSSTELTTNP